MRPLTEEETKVVFEKLANYIGRNISFLIDNPENPHVFRLQKDRVYYVQESIAKFATSVSRQQLMSLGTCFGKFTKTGNSDYILLVYLIWLNMLNSKFGLNKMVKCHFIW